MMGLCKHATLIQIDHVQDTKSDIKEPTMDD